MKISVEVTVVVHHAGTPPNRIETIITRNAELNKGDNPYLITHVAKTGIDKLEEEVIESLKIHYPGQVKPL